MQDNTAYQSIPTVQIGAHTFIIEMKDAATVDGDDRWGEIQFERNRILVSYRNRCGELRPVSCVEDTLLHEMVHAISHVYGIELSETQVTQITSGLLQALKQFGLQLVQGKN